MKKIANLAAGAVLAFTAFGAMAQQSGTIDNWKNVDNNIWMNGTNELCWRDNFWTPATAAANCDGALKPVVEEPKPAEPQKPQVSVQQPQPEVQEETKFQVSADALFDTNKAVIKAEGRRKLDELASLIASSKLEAVVTIGHADYRGSDAANMRLSLRRAQAVKAYLVTKGVDAARIFVEGKGERDPKVGQEGCKGVKGKAALDQCLQPDRRVEINVVGLKAPADK